MTGLKIGGEVNTITAVGRRGAGTVKREAEHAGQGAVGKGGGRYRKKIGKFPQ